MLSLLSFAEPAYLSLLIGAAILAITLVIRKARHWKTSLMRVVAIICLILALAGPVKRDASEQQQLVALLDVSNSIDRSGRNALAELLPQFVRSEKDLELSIFPFGKTLGTNPVRITSSESVDDISQALTKSAGQADSGGTDIGLALQRATAQFSASSILLLTDGIETAGDARAAARNAASRGVRIFPLVPDPTKFDAERLSIASLYSPITANAGDLAEVRASIRNEFSSDRSTLLELWLDQKKLFAANITIPALSEKLVSIKTPALEGGLKRIRAVLRENRESSSADDEVHRWLSVKNKSKLLLLSGDEDDRRVLGKLLNLKGYAVEDIVADGRSEIPTDFTSISTVIFNNVARRQIPNTFLDRLKEFVSHGGGLLLIGGDRSFGLGGYIDTPLEEISPVKFVPPHTTKKRLNSAVALIIDKSRSMKEDDKILAAKRAALAAIQALKDDDFVAVIGFDDNPFVIIEMDQVANVRGIAEGRLRNLTAAGTTHMFHALGAARKSLQRVDAGRKHIIILSDGEMKDSHQDYTGEINRLRSEGTTVSSVAMGLEADVPFMKMLSTNGKGAFYQTLDPSQLPEIFLHDIKISTGEKSMKENQLFPVGVGPSGLLSTSVDSFPNVKGFVETLPKKGSNLELITQNEEQRFPLLASWNVGSGKVIAFASDSNGRWSEPWIGWPMLPRFWVQLLDSLKSTDSEKSGELDFDLRYSIERGAVLLDLVVYDDKLQSEAAPPVVASVLEPGGEPKKLPLISNTRGRFDATIERARPGDYKIDISYGKTKLPPLAVTVPGDAFGEKPGGGINVQTLSDLAFISDGKLNPRPDEVVTIKREVETEERMLWPFILLAFALILVEALLREGSVGQLARIYTLRNKDQMRPKIKTVGQYDQKQRVRAQR